MIDREDLCGKALEMRSRAYTPYSHFRVGAALLCKDGSIYTGCNIENDTVESLDYCAPCGVCRQVIREFCDGSFEIILAKSREEYKVYTLEELLPMGFGPENLDKKMLYGADDRL